MITLPVNANTLVGEGGSRADGEQTGERELGQVSVPSQPPRALPHSSRLTLLALLWAQMGFHIQKPHMTHPLGPQPL